MDGRLVGWLAGWLASWSQSQEREARSHLWLRFVTPYPQRVFCACMAKSSDWWKKRELTVNAIGETAILPEKEVESRNFLDNCRESIAIVHVTTMLHAQCYHNDCYMHRWICRIYIYHQRIYIRWWIRMKKNSFLSDSFRILFKDKISATQKRLNFVL